MRYISEYILKPGIYFIPLECGLKVIKSLSVEPTELEPLMGWLGFIGLVGIVRLVGIVGIIGIDGLGGLIGLVGLVGIVQEINTSWETIIQRLNSTTESISIH